MLGVGIDTRNNEAFRSRSRSILWIGIYRGRSLDDHNNYQRSPRNSGITQGDRGTRSFTKYMRLEESKLETKIIRIIK
jgi:hypothetical protein